MYGVEASSPLKPRIHTRTQEYKHQQRDFVNMYDPHVNTLMTHGEIAG